MPQTKNSIDFKSAFEAMPGYFGLLDIDSPTFTILAVTDDYLKPRRKKRSEVIGRGIFDVFFTDGNGSPDGEKNLRASLKKILSTGNADIQPIVRYDLPDTDGNLAEHYWEVTNTPVKDSHGNILHIINSFENITDRIKSQQQETTLKGLEHVHNLFMQAPVAIAIISGPELLIEMANDPIIHIWGKGPNVLNRRVAEVLPEIKEQGYVDIMKEVIATGNPFYAYETPVKLIRDGHEEEVFFTFFYQPYYEPGETKAAGLMIFANNVTARVHALRKLQETEARFQKRLLYKKALLETHNAASLDGILIVDAKGKILSFNQRFIEIWKMPQQILEAKDDNAAIKHAMTLVENPELFIAGVKHSYENPDKPVIDVLEFNDGRTIERQGYPVISDDGQYYGWSWTFRDITEHKVYEKNIQESEARYRELAQTLEEKIAERTITLQQLNETHQYAEQIGHFGSYRYNFTTQQLTYSDNLYRLLGCEPNEFPACPESFIKFIHPDDVDYVNKATSDAFDKQEISTWEYRIIRKNKAIIHVRGTGNIVENSNGEKYMIGTLQDITSEKEKEAQMKENNALLTHMNKELESFAYISSHDLQEPLRKIQTFASRIIEKDFDLLSETGKEYFVRIQNAGLRMQTLIDDLLTYSRTNTEERKFEKTNLREIIEEITGEMYEDIEIYRAKVEIGTMCRIKVIPFQFRQLMYNLIGNALKFSRREEPPHIVINSEIINGDLTIHPKLSSQLKYCHISVKDNGIGFEPEYAERIFEVFQRLHGRDKYNGTGIGLAIVKKIVENHNGFITAKGELNAGATFDIYLPVEPI